MTQQRLSLEEVVAITHLPRAVIQHYVELGLVTPDTGYTEADVAELRCVRRLMDDLGIEQEAVEVVMRMRQRIVALQNEVQQLRAEVRLRRTTVTTTTTWLEAEWRELG